MSQSVAIAFFVERIEFQDEIRAFVKDVPPSKEKLILEYEHGWDEGYEEALRDVDSEIMYAIDNVRKDFKKPRKKGRR